MWQFWCLYLPVNVSPVMLSATILSHCLSTLCCPLMSNFFTEAVKLKRSYSSLTKAAELSYAHLHVTFFSFLSLLSIKVAFNLTSMYCSSQ